LLICAGYLKEVIFWPWSFDRNSSADFNMLQKTYKHIYPNVNAFQSPIENVYAYLLVKKYMVLFNLATSVRHLSWHTNDGKIIEEVGSADLHPGVNQYFLQHNLIVGDESRVHLFANVLWLAPLPSMYRYHCGKPVHYGDRMFMKHWALFFYSSSEN
jgi:hypothetical protein